MNRRVHSTKENLDWTVHLVWTPEAIRPVGVAGDQLSVLASIPAIAVVLPFRYAGVMAWRVEAVAFPRGRRGLPLVMAWRVMGRRKELKRVVDEIAAALERGDTNPHVRGAIPTDIGPAWG